MFSTFLHSSVHSQLNRHFRREENCRDNPEDMQMQDKKQSCKMNPQSQVRII